MKPPLKSIVTSLLMCVAGAALGLLLARAYLAGTPDYLQGNYSEQHRATGEQVILFGTSWCGYCAATREHLARSGASFADLDIDESAEAREWMTAFGAPGVPVIVIGDRQIRGFRPDAIDKALQQL